MPSPDHFSEIGGGAVHAEAHLAKLDGEIASEPGARPGHQLLARDLACSLEVGGGELRHHVVERIHVMAHVFEESTPHIGQLDRRARIFGGRSAVINWSPRSSRD